MTTYYVDSVEYVKASVTNDVVLDAQPVEIKVNGTWRPATWLGAAGTTRTARTTDLVDFTGADTGSQIVYVRITDTPEIPILSAGRMTIR